MSATLEITPSKCGCGPLPGETGALTKIRARYIASPQSGTREARFASFSNAFVDVEYYREICRVFLAKRRKTTTSDALFIIMDSVLSMSKHAMYKGRRQRYVNLKWFRANREARSYFNLLPVQEEDWRVPFLF